MTIRPRGESWQVDVTVHGKRHQPTYPTELEAKREEERLLALAAQPAEDKSKKVWTLKEAFEKTLTVYWKGTKGERSSCVNAGLIIKYFGGSTPLNKIDGDRIDDFVAHLQEQGNSDATINRKMSCLSTMMTLAEDRGHLGGPKPKFERRTEYEGRVRFLQPGEEKAILETFRLWSMDEAFDTTVILVDTGMRRGELRKLQARDCHFTEDSGSVTVWDSKGDKARTIPMTSRVHAVLKKYCKKCQVGTLFTPSERAYLDDWHKMAAHLGKDSDNQFIPHCLRHTFASRLVMNGVPLATVKELMGHADITTTMIYAHLAPKMLTDAIKTLETNTAG